MAMQGHAGWNSWKLHNFGGSIVIFTALDNEIALRNWMGFPPALSESAAHHLLKKSEIDGSHLIEILFNGLENRWLNRTRAEKKPSKSNWRWKRVATLSSKNKSEELNLERRLIQMIGKDDHSWANAIPTCSGLFDSGGRKANIDLAVRDGDKVTFAELKWKSNHPVYAAIEILGYAAAWIQAIVRADEFDYWDQPEKYDGLRGALSAHDFNWGVLAPAAFYADKWRGLDSLENSLNKGLQSYIESKLTYDSLGYHLKAGFRFHVLPNEVTSPVNLPSDLPDKLKKQLLS